MTYTPTRELLLHVIGAGRLRVDPKTGTAMYRRANPKAVWREMSGGFVYGPGSVRPYIMWSFSHQGALYRCLAHRAVWYVGRGDIEPGLTIDHLDGNKLNNRLDNLSLVTMGDNIRRAFAAGLYPKQHGAYLRALKPAQVTEARRMLAAGVHGVEVARRFDVSTNTVSRIKRGKSYADV